MVFCILYFFVNKCVDSYFIAKPVTSSTVDGPDCSRYSPGALVKILVKSGKKCYKADFFRIVT